MIPKMMFKPWPMIRITKPAANATTPLPNPDASVVRRLCYRETCQADRKETHIRDHVGNIIHKTQRHRPQPFADAPEHPGLRVGK